VTDLTLSESPARPKPRPKGKPRLFDCPACGGSIRLNAVGHSVRAACSHCGSLVDTSNENLRLVQRANEKLRPSLLQLGAYGTLNGKRWQVIGWMEKRDRASLVSWHEYLLFNPFYGFRFLVEADGHWTLLQVVKQRVPTPAGLLKFDFGGRSFTLFQRGKTDVTYVAGEFYWEVQRGETSDVQDFVAPPYLLTIERGHGEINVAHGTYLDPKAVATAFGLGTRLPPRDGVGPNQPSPFAETARKVTKPAILFLAAAISIQIGAVILADNETLVSRNVVMNPSDSEKTIVIPALHLSDELADVIIETGGRLDNQWMEIGFQLVNDQTGRGYTFRNAMESYSGHDGGEYWSEGDRDTETVLSMVPGGNYSLIAEMDAGPPATGRDWVWSLRARRDVALWANFWTTLGFGLSIPFYLGMRHLGFEKKRWAQSDYAPSIYRDS